ncbi:MAG TPA: tetratricopeptide repeat protein [Gemmatimonadaceae bacterium]
MSNVAKLKKRALDYEQKKQFDRALETYVQILAELDDHVDEADVALYNRVGDLMLRQGDVAAAVDHYERAVDLYSDGGFFNNAIALCNKILRNAPGRNSIYYKLGKISAKKGFINDAKQNFLEYADRMQRLGELEEAFRALKEFADLCPDQDDIRLMLADQLVRKDRKGEAVEQLQLLYDKFQSEGRTTEARATVDRMKAIDPALEPKAGQMRPTPKANDLIFLDVNYDEPVGGGASGGRGRGAAAQAAPRQPAPPPERAAPAAPAAPVPDAWPDEMTSNVDLPLLEVGMDGADATDSLSGLAGEAPADRPPPDGGAGLASHADLGLITGFEQTAFGSLDSTSAADIAPLAELEHTIPEDLGASSLLVPGSDALDGATPFGGGLDADAPLGSDLPLLDVDAGSTEPPIGGELTFLLPDDTTPEMGAVDEARTQLPDPGSAEMSNRSLGLPELGESAGLVQEPAVARGRSAPPPAPAAPAAATRASDRHRQALIASPENWELHRRLGEALLEEGDRAGGIAALEAAMLGFERAGDLRGASGVAEELILVESGEARYHQKRVEYAVRAGDKTRLVEAYLSLAESLFSAGQLDKSRAVYQRVLELAPDDVRALSALRSVGRGDTGMPTPPEPAPAAPRAPEARPAPAPAPAAAPAAAAKRPAPEPRRAPVPRPAPIPTPAPAPAPAAPAPTPTPAPAARSDDSFVSLSDWLREDETTKNTRMVVDVAEPVDQEQVDFAEMLNMFKQGVAANLDETDHESHYDLGVAYKEMGLLDEAISEFQKALRGTEQRVRTYEALGQCFVEKQQHQIALTILSRALNDKTYTDDMLVGVLYLLGYASEELGRWQDALRFYERVFAVDIQFRDIGDRLAAVERQAR